MNSDFNPLNSPEKFNRRFVQTSNLMSNYFPTLPKKDSEGIEETTEVENIDIMEKSDELEKSDPDIEKEAMGELDSEQIEQNRINRDFEAKILEYIFKQWGIDWDFSLLCANFVRDDINASVS